MSEKQNVTEEEAIDTALKITDKLKEVCTDKRHPTVTFLFNPDHIEEGAGMVMFYGPFGESMEGIRRALTVVQAYIYKWRAEHGPLLPLSMDPDLAETIHNQNAEQIAQMKAEIN